MEDITSFRIDHTKLEKGLYVSRVDRVGMFSHATTFDVRMKSPYKDAPINPATAHTIEHCLATYLRNKRKDIIYAGPMGCMTGFYVVISGKRKVKDIIASLVGAFQYILRVRVVPGASKSQCGNYTFMDLADARVQAADYLKVLEKML